MVTKRSFPPREGHDFKRLGFCMLAKYYYPRNGSPLNINEPFGLSFGNLNRKL